MPPPAAPYLNVTSVPEGSVKMILPASASTNSTPTPPLPDVLYFHLLFLKMLTMRAAPSTVLVDGRGHGCRGVCDRGNQKGDAERTQQQRCKPQRAERVDAGITGRIAGIVADADTLARMVGKGPTALWIANALAGRGYELDLRVRAPREHLDYGSFGD